MRLLHKKAQYYAKSLCLCFLATICVSRLSVESFLTFLFCITFLEVYANPENWREKKENGK